jgi:hypothetical protein
VEALQNQRRHKVREEVVTVGNAGRYTAGLLRHTLLAGSAQRRLGLSFFVGFKLRKMRLHNSQRCPLM